MSTKVNLDYPFSAHYKCGYLNTNKEPRRVISLIAHNGKRTSVSYARYLMACNLKRYLTKDEHVDHIDNNKLNDVIENLQILSPKENNQKRNKALGIKLADDIELICPVCKKVFHRCSRNTKHKLQKGKSPCCSRKCGGIYSHKRTCIGSVS